MTRIVVLPSHGQFCRQTLEKLHAEPPDFFLPSPKGDVGSHLAPESDLAFNS